MSRFIFIFSFIFLISFESSAEVGVATEYNVTMKKVELCTSLDCSNPTVIGEGTQEVDIASLNAGSDAAKFADTNGLPFGTTFQFLRVTLNRAFTMTGSVDVGGTTCYSDGSTNADATTLHTGSTSSGDLASTPLYIADVGCYGNDSSICMTYSVQNGDIKYGREFTVGTPESTQFQIVYQLTKPYTVGLIAPKISIEFNTSEAIGAGRDNLGTCLFWPAEPYVSISISE